MKRKQKLKYSEDDILNAIAEIKNRNCSYRTASLKYNVPIATLCDKIKQRVPLSSKTGKYVYSLK